jgi:hypothetical protein
VGFHLSKLNAPNEIFSAFATTDYITDMTDVAKLIVSYAESSCQLGQYILLGVWTV